MLIAKLQGESSAKDQEIVRINQIISQAMFTPKIQQVTISNISQSDINIVGDNSHLVNQNITNYQTIYQQLVTETEKEIESLLIDIKEIIPQEKQIINQTILFLGTKELFINYRQEIISRLIDCYCNLASKSKSTKLANFNSIMNITSKIANTIPTGGTVETPLGILGDTINLAEAIIQEKNLKQCIKKLQQIFAKDKESLSLFDENYRSLTQSIGLDNGQGEITKNIIDTLQLDQTQLRPFSINHDVFKVGGV